MGLCPNCISRTKEIKKVCDRCNCEYFEDKPSKNFWDRVFGRMTLNEIYITREQLDRIYSIGEVVVDGGFALDNKKYIIILSEES